METGACGDSGLHVAHRVVRVFRKDIEPVIILQLNMAAENASEERGRGKLVGSETVLVGHAEDSIKVRDFLVGKLGHI